MHLDLDSVQGNRYEFICILLYADIQLCQQHLLKMLSFSIVQFGFFVKNQVSIGVQISLGL